MKRWIIIALTVLLAGCGGSKHVEEVANPYAEHMRELSRNGIIAMQRERLDIAKRSFERALKAAKLANDRMLIAQAWYNLGVVHSATESYVEAEHALHQADREASGIGSEVMVMRTRLALALAHQKQGKDAWRPDSISSSLPVDVQLSAARLFQLQGNDALAVDLYERVASKRATGRQDMVYQAEAYMGLAMLADVRKDSAEVGRQTAKVLEIARDIGIPRLAAHAYLLKAGYGSPAQNEDAYRRSADLYRALDDAPGLKKALLGQLQLAKDRGDQTQMELLKRQLEELDAE